MVKLTFMESLSLFQVWSGVGNRVFMTVSMYCNEVKVYIYYSQIGKRTFVLIIVSFISLTTLGLKLYYDLLVCTVQDLCVSCPLSHPQVVDWY